MKEREGKSETKDEKSYILPKYERNRWHIKLKNNRRQ